MKKVLFMIVILLATIGLQAQSKKIVSGGYGAAISEITWIDGKPALSLGAYGGWLINHKILIGAAGTNSFFKHTVNGRKENFQFNYYGLYTEYRFMPEKRVHASVGLTGALGWQENDLVNAQKSRKRDGDLTYVIVPKLAVNVKVTSFMQVQAYGSYRITGDTKSQYYASGNYNGAAAGVSLVFGSF